MDHDQEYATACHPDRIKILGVELSPFLVGHQFLLKRIKSPFIYDGEYGVVELLTALWVCSHTYAQGVVGLNRAPLGLRVWTWFKAFRCLRLKEGIQPHAEALADYIRAAHKEPSKLWKQSGTESTATPLTLLMFHDLAKQYGYSFETLMEQPLRKVIFERYAILAQDKTIEWKKGWMTPERAHAE